MKGYAFQDLKNAMSSEPVPKHARIGDKFYIDPNAYQLAISIVLIQYFVDHNGKKRLHPIAYESKKLSETKQPMSLAGNNGFTGTSAIQRTESCLSCLLL